MIEEILNECGNSIRMIADGKLLYKENDKKYMVEVEVMLAPGFDVIVHLTGIKNWNKADNYPITPEIMKSISKITKKLFESGGMELKFVVNNPHSQAVQRSGNIVYVNTSKLAI